MSASNATSKLKCVLFDLDGTLIDSTDLIRASFRHAVRTVLGKDLPDSVLLANVGRPLEEQMKILSPEKAEELLKVYREHNHKYHDSMVCAMPGINEVLDLLKEKKVKIGVVTSKSSHLALRGLKVCGLEGYIDAVVAADDVNKPKPDGEPVIKCLTVLGCSKDRAVFIGDSPYDIESGRNAGILTIAVPFGPFSEVELLNKNPDYLAKTITELKDILRKML